jgi:hypothetical protein
MGCDIHLFVERRYKERWVPVDPPRGISEPYRSGSASRDNLDWGDWDLWFERQDSTIKQLADSYSSLERIVPETASDWSFGRDYNAYGQLAEVRGGGPSFLPRRGLPPDLSPQVVDYFYYRPTVGALAGTLQFNSDLHSTHYYTLAELMAVVRQRATNRRIIELVEELEKVAKDYKIGLEDVRIVFGFDN